MKKIIIPVLCITLGFAAFFIYRFTHPTPCYQDEECTWKAFRSIAFGDEFGSDHLQVIRKWTRPVHIWVQTDEPEKFIPPVEEYVKKLRQYIDLPVVLLNTDGEGDYNILVIFSDDFDKDIYGRYKKDLANLVDGRIFKSYERIKKSNALCAGSSYNDKNNSYVLAVNYIPTQHDDVQLKSCIEEEITQGLGLENDNKNLKESMFNDRKSPSSLTPLDIKMLKILYDPRILPGMTPVQVKDIFHEVFTDVTQKMKQEKL